MVIAAREADAQKGGVGEGADERLGRRDHRARASLEARPWVRSIARDARPLDRFTFTDDLCGQDVEHEAPHELVLGVRRVDVVDPRDSGPTHRVARSCRPTRTPPRLRYQEARTASRREGGRKLEEAGSRFRCAGEVHVLLCSRL